MTTSTINQSYLPSEHDRHRRVSQVRADVVVEVPAVDVDVAGEAQSALLADTDGSGQRTAESGKRKAGSGERAADTQSNTQHQRAGAPCGRLVRM